MLRKLYKGVALSCDQQRQIHKFVAHRVAYHKRWGRAKRGCVQSDISTAPFFHPSVGNLGVAIEKLTEIFPKNLSSRLGTSKNKASCSKGPTEHGQFVIVYSNVVASQIHQPIKTQPGSGTGSQICDSKALFLLLQLTATYHTDPFLTELKMLSVSEDAYVFERMLASHGINSWESRQLYTNTQLLTIKCGIFFLKMNDLTVTDAECT